MANESQIQNAIFVRLFNRYIGDQNLYFDITANCHFFGWESDILFKNARGQIYEVEIKCSLSDYQAEFAKKTKKHRALSKRKGKIPAWYYLIVPIEIKDKIKVPEYAGLYTFSEHQCKERGVVIETYLEKEAPILTDYIADEYDTIKMLRSTAFKYWRQRTGLKTLTNAKKNQSNRKHPKK